MALPLINLPSFPFPGAQAAQPPMPPMPPQPVQRNYSPIPAAPMVTGGWVQGLQVPPELYAAAQDQGPSQMPPPAPPMPPEPALHAGADPQARDDIMAQIAAERLGPIHPDSALGRAIVKTFRLPVSTPPGTPLMGQGVTAAPLMPNQQVAADALAARKPAPPPQKRKTAAKAKAKPSDSDILNQQELARIQARRKAGLGNGTMFAKAG